MKQVVYTVTMLLLGLGATWSCRHDTPPGANEGSGRASVHLSGAKCGNGKCEIDRKEDCAGCPEDCGRCTGCQENMAAGCFGCKCEQCVCATVPSCCGAKGRWGPQCVKACKAKCGGCGATTQKLPARARPGKPTSDRWTCGDGSCDVDLGEDCGLCQKDCGLCNGCQPRFVGGCQGCRCEQCVCKKIPSCCGRGGRWTKKCVEACKSQCGGCNLPPAGKRAKPAAKKKKGAVSSAPAAQCGNGKCDGDRGEDCVVCPRDCGMCNGCQVKLGPGCLGCKCEKCVCKALPSCCKAGKRWGPKCVAACKGKCGGC